MNRDPQLLALVSLARGPRHGYAMQKDIEVEFGIHLGPGTLYGAIARLESRGLIRVTSAGARRRPYELTEDGRRELRERLAGLSSVVALGLSRLATQ